MSNQQNFNFYSGEHWVVAVTYLDGDGLPIDLTGAAAVDWAVSQTKNSAPVHTATLANGEIVVTDAAAGRADISVPPASQPSVPAGTYHHESRITNASGIVSVQFHGTLTVTASILS